MTRLLPLLAAAGTALAQTTTVNLVIPLDNPETLYGSVINAEPEATTYAVACPEGVTDDLQCKILNTQTVIQGPSTVSIHYSFAGDDENGYFTEDLACKVNFEQDVATCNIQIAQGKKGGSTSTTSVETTQTALSKVMRPVTVTDGVDKLEAASTSAGTEKPSTSAAPASSTPSNAAMTNSEASEATASTGSAVTSASASASPETVSGASNMVLKGSQGVVVVGMAALVAAVALL